ncbi:MAG: hypothetical protein GY866_33865 [Proteobacteria bacterium]|nr:hypothetical protein [Pseudomonadota bacterium]
MGRLDKNGSPIGNSPSDAADFFVPGFLENGSLSDLFGEERQIRYLVQVGLQFFEGGVSIKALDIGPVGKIGRFRRIGEY